MTYDQEKVKLGREPVVVAEIRVDKCRNVFGVSPCTAVGSNKCFNTCKTCQDLPHYNPTTVSQMFSNRPLRSAGSASPGKVFVGGAGTIFTEAPGGAALGTHGYIETIEDGGDLWALDGTPIIRARTRVVTTFVIT